MKDKQGREYATIKDTKVGDLLEADGDFTCIIPHAIVEVAADEEGLWVPCKEGRHHLHGQIEDNYYIGLYPVGQS